ncbi:hypothetical protein KIN20_012071 [Parelaphostrongylus tenuis]|uniref:Uncharacterized protein n=1 Tax=Parelaphostrongylus tenuis TaxID=148309 RepID=A0AAD5MUG2_PARTN|nr:hypothetical protein KIN20_012071 [Parelaphostrongylus tenuis]
MAGWLERIRITNHAKRQAHNSFFTSSLRCLSLNQHHRHTLKKYTFDQYVNISISSSDYKTAQIAPCHRLSAH